MYLFLLKSIYRLYYFFFKEGKSASFTSALVIALFCFLWLATIETSLFEEKSIYKRSLIEPFATIIIVFFVNYFLIKKNSDEFSEENLLKINTVAYRSVVSFVFLSIIILQFFITPMLAS